MAACGERSPGRDSRIGSSPDASPMRHLVFPRKVPGAGDKHLLGPCSGVASLELIWSPRVRRDSPAAFARCSSSQACPTVTPASRSAALHASGRASGSPTSPDPLSDYRVPLDGGKSVGRLERSTASDRPCTSRPHLHDRPLRTSSRPVPGSRLVTSRVLTEHGSRPGHHWSCPRPL